MFLLTIVLVRSRLLQVIVGCFKCLGLGFLVRFFIWVEWQLKKLLIQLVCSWNYQLNHYLSIVFPISVPFPTSNLALLTALISFFSILFPITSFFTFLFLFISISQPIFLSISKLSICSNDLPSTYCLYISPSSYSHYPWALHWALAHTTTPQPTYIPHI